MRPKTSVRPAGQRAVSRQPKKSNTNAEGLERVLAMTRELITRSGIDHFNMRDLAAAAGSSLRTLYAQVESKDHLLLMVIADTFETLNRRIQDGSSKKPAEAMRVVRLARSIQEISSATFSYVRTIMGIYYKNDGYSEVSKTVYEMTYERMSTCVDELVDPTITKPRHIALVKEETTDRLLSVMMKWTQKRIPDRDLAHRLIYSILTCVLPHADPKHSHDVSRAIENALNGIRSHSTTN